MRTLKVFIASSEELRLERLEFADMIQHLNRILKPRGIEIEPIDNHEEYNRELKNCELCLVLYWTRFGDYTKSEFDTAYSELCAGRNPQKLYVYFKDADEITPELRAFKESFDTQYGHFFCRFENVDTLKLNFLLQFEAYQNKGSEAMLQVRDSQVEIDGQPFVELKNIPFAGNNPEYLQLLKQIEATQARVLKYPGDLDFRQELHDLQERRKAMESSLLDTAKLITRLSSTTTSARLTEAMRLFEAGDNKGANAILNLDEITRDAEANAARLDAVREIESETLKALESNIEEYRLKIKTLQNEMERGWVAEVITVYDKAIAVAHNRIAPEKVAELLLDYADFLQNNKQYHLVGTLYEEALTIYRTLAAQNPEAFESDVASTLNNLALLHSDTQQLDWAEKEYIEALEIYHRLAQKNPEAFESDVARTLNNLAVLHKNTRRLDLAEKEYNEALEIQRRLAQKNPEAFESDVARTLNNLANLHSDTQQLDLAEKEYTEALEIRRRLAQKNPETFESDVASTLNNLAVLHQNTQRLDLAEKEYIEALEIYHRLAQKNPEAFESDVALTLNNLALLHKNTRRLDWAEKEYIEALEIRRRLAQKNPEAFESDVASTLNNLALLHDDIQRRDLAEKEHNEALEIRRRLAQKNPEAFESKVARTLIGLALLHADTQRFDLAIKELQEALTIYNRMAQYTDVEQEYIEAIESLIKELQEQSTE
ncbi:tetratricopeptide repeat protein [Barnesiella sp. An22]|uniref:tetratricopeptide repeat protein n=1 Tax=Barnesiella sp. An22 TaxID=1965590 RepID=UPI000B378F49|nr:tetratricopeptide repeat protein [Barnesiella sp. An22]OUO98865.1 hypothetical protein B5F38_02705 [Barnesiella sp. An22]